ncbi:hypothetical protein G7054_g10039 [Neopestalotiopsis clavispora]|nr:hypothetical protein G7054_g10039 [Neopestalotiopsis clavispora]
MILIKVQSLVLAIASFFWMATVTANTNTLACDTEYTSGLPSTNFSPSIYAGFCAEVDKYEGHQAVSWTVDINGAMLIDQLLQDQTAASPSVDTDSSTNSGYTFDLTYNPTKKGVACGIPTACAGNFEALRSRCSTQTAMGTNLMTYRGSQGSGCGLFTYYITPPKPKNQERRCYPLNFFGSHHMMVQEWVLDRLLRTKVCKPGRPRVAAHDKSTWLQNEQFWINSVPYVFNVYWIDGCYQKQMDVDFIYPLDGHEGINCYHLLWDDYAACLSNDGIGGNMTVGCVVYEYKTIDQHVPGEGREMDIPVLGEHWEP